MTVNDFLEKTGASNRQLVSWISKGLVPGADLANNYIPDSARKPYTATRAKTPRAIYKSIIKATECGQHVLPAMFKICDEEFNGYIERLARDGKIIIRITDGITYYDLPVPKGINADFALQLVEVHSRGTSEGITNAMLNKANPIGG